MVIPGPVVQVLHCAAVTPREPSQHSPDHANHDLVMRSLSGCGTSIQVTVEVTVLNEGPSLVKQITELVHSLDIDRLGCLAERTVHDVHERTHSVALLDRWVLADVDERLYRLRSGRA